MNASKPNVESENKKQLTAENAEKGFRNELSVKDKTNITFSFYRTSSGKDLSVRSFAWRLYRYASYSASLIISRNDRFGVWHYVAHIAWSEALKSLPKAEHRSNAITIIILFLLHSAEQFIIFTHSIRFN